MNRILAILCVLAIVTLLVGAYLHAIRAVTTPPFVLP